MFKHRYLIVKRRENLSESEPGDLKLMLEYLPEWVILRRFADRIYWLFATPKDWHLASCRFPKLMAFLNNPRCQRVRTNNHVERTNRMIRFLEKVRYKWRRRRTLVRFVVLTLDEIWKAWEPPKPKEASRRPKASPRHKTQPQATQSSRRGA